MRPKPTREWVMLELEKLGVRVVSGRLGRKAGEEGDDGSAGAPDKRGMAAAPNQGQMNHGMGGMGGGMPRNNSMGWGSDADLTNLIASRRNSSLGLSMMNDTMGRRGSLSSLGQIIGLDDAAMPPHRPFVGGGAAAAFEAARHDHFTQKSAEQQRRASSLGLGSLGGGMSGMGMSVNPNQHYEMLKLHHMNLLNEIQETTLMMNLYQQQQLQQQQQQLQQQAAADQLGGGADSQLSMLMQQQGGGGMNGGTSNMDPLFGASQLHQRASLGLGGPQFSGSAGGNFNNSGSGSGGGGGGMNNGMGGGSSDEMQNRMSAMQNEMSGNGGNKESKEGGSSPNKRSAGDDERGDTKRAKTDT